jgi:hypothetical protein
MTLGGYSGATGRKDLQDDLGYIADSIWGTSYNATPISLPVKSPPTPWSGPPNLSIRQSEIRQWLIDGNVTVTSLLYSSAQPTTIGKLISADKTGTFSSSPQHGLVILILDRRKNFEDFRAEFRKFALETDVLFGAVEYEPNYLLFVGREREVPITIMPPLRFETAHILACATVKDLAQSYERNQIFAGRLNKGAYQGMDWAPIYLSPSLINTELGSTLNITDQMLKSWSMAGKVAYHNFHYPAPSHLPFDGHPLIEDLMKKEPEITETLFNWNTTGAFSEVRYSAAKGDPLIHSWVIQNSGSLPIIYKDESRPEFDNVFGAFERDGYRYYRDLHNPWLTRVTSYQVIFQATRDRPLPTEMPPGQSVITPPQDLQAYIANRFEALVNMGNIKRSRADALCTVQILLGAASDMADCESAMLMGVQGATVFKASDPELQQRVEEIVLDRNSQPELSVREHYRALGKH